MARKEIPPVNAYGVSYTGPDLSCDIEDATYFAHVTVKCGFRHDGKQMLTSFVKEADFFKEQGGLDEPWGKAWIPIRASSIKEAHRKICQMYGGIPSPIHD